MSQPADDLDALLDDALDQFAEQQEQEKQEDSHALKSPAEPKDARSTSNPPPTSSSSDASLETQTQQLLDLLQQAVQSGDGEEGEGGEADAQMQAVYRQMMEQIQNLSAEEAAAAAGQGTQRQGTGSSSAADADASAGSRSAEDSFADASKRFTSGTEGSDGGMDDSVMKAMQELLGSDGQAGAGDLGKELTEYLMSKEVLYQPLKNLLDEYPGWLEDRRGSFSQEQVAQYEGQISALRNLISEFDCSDNEGVTSERIVQLMEEYHKFGQPPVELMNKLAPDMQFDANGQPQFPVPSPGECPQQ